MPKNSVSNVGRLTQYNDASFKLIVPKALVLSKGWKHGDRIMFFINNVGRLELEKVEGDGK